MNTDNSYIPDLNIDILKANIDNLRKQHGLTQEQLATKIGTSQSNLSKALNAKYKQSVTFEQIYKIAKLFDVSMDSLVTNSGTESIDNIKTTKKQFAKFLISIFNSFEVEFIDYTRYEDHYEIISPKTMSELEYDVDNYDPVTRQVSYDAIIFPKHWLIPKDEEILLVEDLAAIHSEASAGGTELSENKVINEFISKFKTIHKLYKDNLIPKSAYDAAIKQYLSEIKE